MIAYTRKQFFRLLKLDFVRFCVVGGTGFVINFLLLTFFHKIIGLNVFTSQLLAAEIALFSNFMLHHHWTYKSHKVNKTIWQLLVQFHVTTWPAIIGSAAMVWVGERILHLGNFTALAISSSIALFWNFGWSKYVVWRDVRPKEIEEIAK